MDGSASPMSGKSKDEVVVKNNDGGEAHAPEPRGSSTDASAADEHQHLQQRTKPRAGFIR